VVRKRLSAIEREGVLRRVEGVGERALFSQSAQRIQILRGFRILKSRKVRFECDADSTLSGLAATEFTQGRRWCANPGLYDSNPVGVGEKDTAVIDRHYRQNRFLRASRARTTHARVPYPGHPKKAPPLGTAAATIKRTTG